jgi:rod shape-determining protein MreC
LFGVPKLFFSKRIRIFIVCALALIFLLVVFPSSLKGIKNFCFKTLSIPIRIWSGTMQYFATKGSLLEANKSLSKTLADLTFDMERFEDLKSENERLRDLLKLKRKVRYDTVSAEVVARDPSDWISSFVINKGTADGIRKYSAVYSAKGLVGKVTDPGENASPVMLVTHPNFKAGGMVKDSRVQGVVVGAGKSTVKMLYIPMDADVAAGDVIMTSGLSRIFPKGLVIGSIVSVGKSKTGLYKYAIIKPSAYPFDQEEVLCIE